MKIWIVAAGTGGHIFPGLSLASEIKKLVPAADFLFFGSAGRLETEIVPKAGYRLKLLKAGRWKGMSLVQRLLGLWGLFLGFWQALSEVLKNRPTCLISVGGYVSTPVALACALCRVPVFLIEPNIKSGLANVSMSKFARKAFCVPGSDALTKFSCPTLDSGVPVRAALNEVVLKEQVKRILVLGGSQGAKALCEAICEIQPKLRAENPGLEILLQTGAAHFDSTSERAKSLQGLELKSFIENMSQVLGGCDLVIARAGASTIAELAITGHPTIFVPFPYAADDHQRYNVKLLQKSGAAVYVEEKDSNFLRALREAVEDLSLRDGHYKRRRDLSVQFKKWGRPEAGTKIAKEILSLVKQ